MNEVIENMITRRSVRKFRNDEVPKEKIDEIIKAGTYAATGRGMQSPIIIEISDKKIRNEISKLNSEIMGADIDPFYGAPVILAVIADKSVSTHVYDGSLVLGNMMLAAHSLGLGSCWIHRAKEEFESEYGKNLLRKLGIEGEYEGIGHLAVGYADTDMCEAAARKENYVYRID